MSRDNPTLIETDRIRRASGRPVLGPGEGALTPKIKARVIYMLEEGATLTEISRTKGLPSRSAIRAERKRDPQFESDVRDARIVGVETKLDLCNEHAEREAESRDPDRMRVAQMLSAVTTTYAEKIAPREYGQLVKLGGEAGMPLAVNVIDYSNALIGGALTPVDSDDTQTDARATAPEALAVQAGNDASAATRGKAGSKRAVPSNGPRTSGRRLATDHRQTKAKKASKVAR